MLVTTMDSLPGWTINEILGEVLGVSLCDRNPYNVGVKILNPDDERHAVAVLLQLRAAAVSRMSHAAGRLGATAVTAARFDHRDVSNNWVEICAYGTAVVAEKIQP